MEEGEFVVAWSECVGVGVGEWNWNGGALWWRTSMRLVEGSCSRISLSLSCMRSGVGGELSVSTLRH